MREIEWDVCDSDAASRKSCQRLILEHVLYDVGCGSYHFIVSYEVTEDDPSRQIMAELKGVLISYTPVREKKHKKC